MKYALPYSGEAWLYKNHPRAWGYHKAMMYESDNDRLEALAAIVPADDMAAIRKAYGLVANSR